MSIPPRRQSVITVCEACRERQTECDEALPICSSCRTHGLRCFYPQRLSEWVASVARYMPTKDANTATLRSESTIPRTAGEDYSSQTTQAQGAQIPVHTTSTVQHSDYGVGDSSLLQGTATSPSIYSPNFDPIQAAQTPGTNAAQHSGTLDDGTCGPSSSAFSLDPHLQRNQSAIAFDDFPSGNFIPDRTTLGQTSNTLSLGTDGLPPSQPASPIGSDAPEPVAARGIDTSDRTSGEVSSPHSLGANASQSIQFLNTGDLSKTPSRIILSGRASFHATVQTDDGPKTVKVSRPIPQKHTHSHSIFLWPKIWNRITTSSVPMLVSIAALKFNELGWVKQLQKPSWEGSLHCLPMRGVSTIEPTIIPRYQEVLGHPLEVIYSLTGCYFDSFNILYPLLERGEFYAKTLPIALTDPDGTSYHVILTLLLMALGEMTQQGIFGYPLNEYRDRSSGVRGGTAESPPGCLLFDKARQRLALAGTGTEYDLASLQAYCLTALYFGQCCRHLDMWHAIVTAGHRCQMLLSTEALDWRSNRGDQIKLVYWNCVLMETVSHLELGLPSSGIERFEFEVPAPEFAAFNHPTDIQCEQDTHYRLQFRSLISICRAYRSICFRFFQGPFPVETQASHGVPQTVVRPELATQVDTWRSQLPLSLKWTDNVSSGNSPLRSPQSGLEALDNSPPWGYIRPILKDRLKIYFYRIRYLMYRPYLYKVLHYPELANGDDVANSVRCLKSCVGIHMYLYEARNILVPFQIVFSQEIIATLLLLQLAFENDKLRDWPASNFYKDEVKLGTQTALEWIQDMRQVDGIAEWGWKVFTSLSSYK